MSEAFTSDARRAMTPARKRRIHAAWEGKCWFCKMPVPESGPEVVYDHVGTLWITGSDADKDIGPIHAATCNKLKTAADLKKIAKIKRLQDIELNGRPPGTIKGRGFERPKTKRPWPKTRFPSGQKFARPAKHRLKLQVPGRPS